MTADEVYGSDRRLRMWLESKKSPYVLAIKANDALWVLTESGPQQLHCHSPPIGIK